MSYVLANNTLFLNTFLKYSITSPLRIAHFLAQLAHESNDFTVLSENLNYTPQGLLDTFSSITSAQANLYGRTTQHKANQIMIANIVYANKGGNGNVASGDGWKYRGRGFIQLTLKDNYIAYKKYSGHDVVNNPDLLLRPDIALDCSAWYFSVYKRLNPFADSNLIKSITSKINPALKGLADRVLKFNFYTKQNITIDVLKKKTTTT